MPLTTVEGHPPRGRLPTTPAARSPHRACRPSQVGREPGPGGPPPSTPDGARDRGRTRRGAWTTWNGPTSDQSRDRARCARHTTQGGVERTPRERERTHTQRVCGDYQKGNRTELAERTDRFEWRTSERGYVTPGRDGPPQAARDTRGGKGPGNGRDTTPGTGPSPPNRPRAPRTQGWGTAPAKAVLAHCATPQPLG